MAGTQDSEHPAGKTQLSSTNRPTESSEVSESKIASVDPAKFYLVVHMPGQRATARQISSGQTLVGRNEDCQIQLSSTTISRYHCEISITPKGVFVRDHDSTNGTFVNGEKIDQLTQLQPGDRISIGDVNMTLRCTKTHRII
jgi:pSer/pThr/pTyr-binding forkhead associated (FHA) protein